MFVGMAGGPMVLVQHLPVTETGQWTMMMCGVASRPDILLVMSYELSRQYSLCHNVPSRPGPGIRRDHACYG
jgi:hypothetical protein